MIVVKSVLRRAVKYPWVDRLSLNVRVRVIFCARFFEHEDRLDHRDEGDYANVDDMWDEQRVEEGSGGHHEEENKRVEVGCESRLD